MKVLTKWKSETSTVILWHIFVIKFSQNDTEIVFGFEPFSSLNWTHVSTNMVSFQVSNLAFFFFFFFLPQYRQP